MLPLHSRKEINGGSRLREARAWRTWPARRCSGGSTPVDQRVRASVVCGGREGWSEERREEILQDLGSGEEVILR